MTAHPLEPLIAPADNGARRHTAMWCWTGALVLLCITTLLLFFRSIEGTLPYPQHTDEVYITGPASDVLVKGQLNPQSFNYPSLPTYITAMAMAVGFVRSAAHLEVNEVSQIGNVGYPHYATPRVMQAPRRAFALLSVVCVALTGLCAWMALRRPAAILLAPGILVLSPLYFYHSCAYLNVDIVATSFAMMVAAAVLAGMLRPSILRSAVLPGMFAGLAAGSKYTLAVTILPVMLAIGLYVPRQSRISAWVAAVAAVVLAFLAAVPYSVLDIPRFLNGVGYEAYHYASGHAGFSDEPGWPQLVYYGRNFVTQFGQVGSIAGVLGVAALASFDWRRAAVLASFPAGLLWLLATQRVHFERNTLALQPVIAIFCACGLLTVHGQVAALAARAGWTLRRLGASAMAGALMVPAALPFWNLPDNVRGRIDSRNIAREWIGENLSRDYTVVVPSELGLDARGLEQLGRVPRVVALRPARDRESLEALLRDVPAPAVILVPRWGADKRRPGKAEADLLNDLTQGWRVLKTFGSNDVLVNSIQATAWGDPAFSIAVLR